MRRTMSFFIGVLLGGLVGGTLGILLAPASGSELRAQIRDRAENVSVEMRQAANTKRIELQERLENLRAPKA